VLGGIFVGRPSISLPGSFIFKDSDQFEVYNPLEVKGITTPRNEFFSIEGATFYNFDGSTFSSAI